MQKLVPAFNTQCWSELLQGCSFSVGHSYLNALDNDRNQNQTFCDFTIVAGADSLTQTRFPVHKCVVGVASEFFKKSITTEMKEKYHNIVTLVNVEPNVMELVLNYMYGKSITINNDNIDDLFAASDYLQVFHLNSACVEYISQASLTERNYIALWTFAKENALTNLLQKCNSYITQNFFQLYQQDQFLTISTDNVKSFLDMRGDILNPKALFQLIVKWVQFDEEKRQDHFPNLFKLVELDKIELSYILSTIFENKLVQNSLKSLQAVTKIVRKFVKTPSELLVVDTADCVVNKCDVMLKNLRRVSILPKTTEEAGVLSSRGVLYLIGGHSSCTLNSFTSVYALDLSSKTWTKKTFMVQKRSRFGCAVLGNSIFVVGGQAHKMEILNSVECYSIRSNSWTSKPSMPTKRAGCCLVERNGYLYALGGDTSHRSGSSTCAKVEFFNGYNWAYEESMTNPRSDFAAVVLNDEIYAIGGNWGESPDDVYDSVEVFNFGDEEWEFIADLNYPRKGHSACVVEGKIYVAGGTDSSGDVAPVEVFDSTDADGEWRILGEISSNQEILMFGNTTGEKLYV